MILEFTQSEMNQQLQLDWTKTERHRENNPVSQSHHDANYFHFVGQDAFVLSLLQKGERLTTGNALRDYRIGDLRRRIKTLRDNGIPIQDEWMKDDSGKKTRFKIYYLKPNTNS